MKKCCISGALGRVGVRGSTKSGVQLLASQGCSEQPTLLQALPRPTKALAAKTFVSPKIMLYCYFVTGLGAWGAWHSVLYVSTGRPTLSSSASPNLPPTPNVLDMRESIYKIKRNTSFPPPLKKWIPFPGMSLLCPSLVGDTLLS